MNRNPSKNGNGNGSKIPSGQMSAPSMSPDRMRWLARVAVELQPPRQVSSDDDRIRQMKVCLNLATLDETPEEMANSFTIPRDTRITSFASIHGVSFKGKPVYVVKETRPDRLILRTIGQSNSDIVVKADIAKFNGIRLRDFDFGRVINVGDCLLVDQMSELFEVSGKTVVYRQQARAIGFPRYSRRSLKMGDRWITQGRISWKCEFNNDHIIDTEMKRRDATGDEDTICVRAPPNTFAFPPEADSTVFVRALLTNDVDDPWGEFATGHKTPWQAESVTTVGIRRDGRFVGLKAGDGDLCRRGPVVAICASEVGWVWVPSDLMINDQPAKMVSSGAAAVKVRFLATINRLPDNGELRTKDVNRCKWRAVYVELKKTAKAKEVSGKPDAPSDQMQGDLDGIGDMKETYKVNGDKIDSTVAPNGVSCLKCKGALVCTCYK